MPVRGADCRSAEGLLTSPAVLRRLFQFLVVPVSLSGCGGGVEEIATKNRTFYDWAVATGADAGVFEERYPPLDLAAKDPHPEYVGVTVLRRGIHMSKPKNWLLRDADNQPGQAYVGYISPNAYSFAIYERPESVSEPWRDILKRYEDDASSVGAKVIGKRVPVATGIGQGRAYSIRARRGSRQAPVREQEPRVRRARPVARRGGADRVRRRKPDRAQHRAFARHRHPRGPVKEKASLLVAALSTDLRFRLRVRGRVFQARGQRAASCPCPLCVKPLERSATGVSSGRARRLLEDGAAELRQRLRHRRRRVDELRGRPAFSESDLLQAEGPRTGSLPAKPDNAVVTPGPDGFSRGLARTFQFADGSSSGPLALVRPREGYAEVYGTGTYRGKLKNTRFSLERMGSRLLVTATNEGCTEVKPGQSCETSFDVFLLGQGRLGKGASLALDRIDYRPFPGLSGLAKFRLTATPVFQEKAMRVVEQVEVQDQNQSTVRKSDLERVFKLGQSGELKPSAPSLWSEVPEERAAPPPPPPPPSATPEKKPKGRAQPSQPSAPPPQPNPSGEQRYVH